MLGVVGAKAFAAATPSWAVEKGPKARNHRGELMVVIASHVAARCA
jgi:hypothetical protein